MSQKIKYTLPVAFLKRTLCSDGTVNLTKLYDIVLAQLRYIEGFEDRSEKRKAKSHSAFKAQIIAFLVKHGFSDIAGWDWYTNQPFSEFRLQVTGVSS